MNHADFLAGVDATAAGDPTVTRHADDLGDLDTTVGIKSIAIKGIKGAATTTSFFQDSNFSAGAIGTVSLINVAYDCGQAGANAGEEFGFWASSIKSVTHKNLSNSADNWAWTTTQTDKSNVDFRITQLV